MPPDTISLTSNIVGILANLIVIIGGVVTLYRVLRAFYRYFQNNASRNGTLPQKALGRDDLIVYFAAVGLVGIAYGLSLTAFLMLRWLPSLRLEPTLQTAIGASSMLALLLILTPVNRWWINAFVTRQSDNSAMQRLLIAFGLALLEIVTCFVLMLLAEAVLT
jgi:hypothetical protein